MGPVDCWTPALPDVVSLSSVTSCLRDVWLVMMRTIGPAPNAFGETETRLSNTLALTLIGTGGLSLFFWGSLLPPPAPITPAPTPPRVSANGVGARRGRH